MTGQKGRERDMAGTGNILIREMTIDDYDKVYALWTGIRGFAIRSIDDSREGVERFIRRNPRTSVVAEQNGRIIGSILCGHDGRRACFYHVCVEESYRKQGVGDQMVRFAIRGLQREGISKVTLIAFKRNEVGNAFWDSLGWTKREDINVYDLVLKEENTIRFVE